MPTAEQKELKKKFESGFNTLESSQWWKPPVVELPYAKYSEDPEGFGRECLDWTCSDDVRRVLESVVTNRITIVESANSTGKSQPIETPVLTPAGYRPIGELQIGDYVIGANGKPTMVIGVYPQGLQPTYRIAFSDGSSTLCSEDHLWKTRTSSNKYAGRGYKILTTKKLASFKSSIYIPLCDPVQFPEKDLPVSQYLLGALIGDGNLRVAVRINAPDPYIIDKVRREASEMGVGMVAYTELDYGFTTTPGQPNPLLNKMRELGLIGSYSQDKFIPEEYLLGSVEQRKELLAGLMDTDGYVDSRGVMVYTTTSPKLAENVRSLVQSLGGVATLHTKDAWFTYRGERKQGQLAYNVGVKLPFCPFQLPKKAERWKHPDETYRPLLRVIKSVEPVGAMESVCIKVDAPDSLYLTEQCIVTHNTNAGGVIATWFYKCYPNAKVHLLAAPPEENLKTKLWAEVGRIKFNHPKVFADDYTDQQFRISRYKPPCEEFIEGITIPVSANPAQIQASVAGSHAPHQLYLLDEGDGIHDAVYDGIETCMTGPHERMVIFLNPREQRGRPWELRVSGQANVLQISALRHPNVVTGRVIYDGAVTRDLTVSRINSWTQPLSPGEVKDGACFDVPDFLVGCTAIGDSGKEFPPLPAGTRKIIKGKPFACIVLGQYDPRGSERHYYNREHLALWLEAAKQKQPFEILHEGNYGLHSTWEIYEEPDEDQEYVLGADVAKGLVKGVDKSIDRDFSEAAIYSRTTLRQVAAGWGREGCSPEDWAHDLDAMGRHFYSRSEKGTKPALCIVEVNNHGRSTLNTLINVLRYPNVYYRMPASNGRTISLVENLEWGFETTPRTKSICDNYLADLINDASKGWCNFEMRSGRQIQQCMDYGHLPNGGAGALVGHDDGQRANALCAVVLIELPVVDRVGVRKANRLKDLKPIKPKAYA